MIECIELETRDPSYEEFLRMELSHRFTASLEIQDKEGLYCLINVLKCNEQLYALKLKTIPLDQNLLDALASIFEKNTTLCQFEVESNRRSYTNLFRPSVERNKRKPRGIHWYNGYLLQAGIDLSTVLEKNLALEVLQERTAAIVEEVIFNLPLDKLKLEERKACYRWIIYLLSQEAPCALYRDLIERAVQGLYGLSLEDLGTNHVDDLVWSEKVFKNAYLKIQEGYQDYFKSRKLQQYSLKGALNRRLYKRCCQNLKVLLQAPESKVDLNYAEDCLGRTTVILLLEGIFPIYMGDRESNAKHTFSKALNWRRALFQAEEEGVYCPDRQQLIIDFLNVLPSYLRANISYDQMVKKTKIWRDKFQICSLDEFLSVVEAGDLEALKSLNYLPYYLQMNLTQDYPVCIAAKKGSWDIVKWLIEQGVEVDVSDEKWIDYRSALDYVFYEGNIEIAEWLVARFPIHVNQATKAGHFPLFLASSNFQLEMLDWLLAKGVSIQSLDNNKNSLLHQAIEESDDLEWIKLLIQRGIDINIKGKFGNTALHLAVEKRWHEAVIYLVESGAEVNVSNHQRRSVLSLQKDTGREGRELYDFLIVHGAGLHLLEEGELTKALLGVKSAKLVLYERQLSELSTFLCDNGNLSHLDLVLMNTMLFRNEIKEAELVRAVEKNESLIHFSVVGFNEQQAAECVPYIKRNKMWHEIQFLKPYIPYLDAAGLYVEKIFAPERLEVSERLLSHLVSEQIQWIIFSVPYERMSKEDQEVYRKACYEWVIYLLADAPQAIEYDDLLKLAFLFLLGRKSPDDYRSNAYDVFIQRKDLWVWSEIFFESIRELLQKHFPEYISEIPTDNPVDQNIYEALVSEIVWLFEEQFEEASACLKKAGIEKEVGELLALGFKPLYLEAREENASIVFDHDLQCYRQSGHRKRISHEASMSGFLCHGSQSLMTDPVSLPGEEFFYERSWISCKRPGENLLPALELKNKIQAFQSTYDVCTLKQFCQAFEKNGWDAMESLNYLDHYLHCVDDEGNTLLHFAARQGNFYLIKRLVDEGCSLNIKNEAGLMPLHFALIGGHEELFFHLFKKQGFGVENHEISLLFLSAVEGGCLGVVQRLTQYGFSWDRAERNHDGRTALYVALVKEHEEMAQWIIEGCPTIQYEIDEETLLLVIEKGFLSLVPLLIQRGCSFDFQVERGLTPLLLALEFIYEKQYREIITLLIRSGCNLEIPNKRGLTPLRYMKNFCELMCVGSTFWHLPVIHGALHEPMSEDDLMAVLRGIETATLSVTDLKEFKILARLLKENRLPVLHKLELRLSGNAFDQNVLLEIFKYNRSLLHFTFYENEKEYSHFFKNFTDRNRWIARFKPYEEYLIRLNLISCEEIWTEKALFVQVVPEIIAEFLSQKILQLPLDQFSEQDSLLFYQWVIELLASEQIIEEPYIPLLKIAFNRMLIIRGDTYLLEEKPIEEWVSLARLWVWSLENFKQTHKTLENLYPGFLPPVDDYEESVLAIRKLLDDGSSTVRNCVGEERAHLICLGFIPLLLEESTIGMQALNSTSLAGYNRLIQLERIRDEEIPMFPKILHHLVANYLPSFFRLPFDEQTADISRIKLLVYKVASILSCEHYWKSISGGKLSDGIEVMKKIGKDFPMRGDSLEVCERFLEAIREASVCALNKKSKILIGSLHFFSIHRADALQALYQCLSELPDESMDLALDKIWVQVQRWKGQQNAKEETNGLYSMAVNEGILPF